MERAARYLKSFDGNAAVTAQLWVDYLEAAAKLKYDLTQDDVRMPRDLAERHDLAAASLQTAEDERPCRRRVWKSFSSSKSHRVSLNSRKSPLDSRKKSAGFPALQSRMSL